MKIFASKYKGGDEYDYNIIDFAGLRLIAKPFKHIASHYTQETLPLLKNIFDWVFQNTNARKYVYIDMGEIIIWDGNHNIKEVLFTLIESAKENGKYDRLEIIDNNFALKSKDLSKIPYSGIDYMLGYRRDDDESMYPVDIRDRNIKKHFICLNKRPHQHRLDMVEWINNSGLSDKFYYSLSEVVDGHPLKKVLDFDFAGINHFHHLSAGITTNHYQSFCNIVTESRFDTKFDITDWFLDNFEFDTLPQIHITEKTTKAFIVKQPLIMLGGHHFLKYLKKSGFKTFDKWWDESYDNEEDYKKRFQMITKLIEDISSWSHQKLKITLMEMEDVLNHNYDNAMKLYEKHMDYRRMIEIDLPFPNEEPYRKHFQTL